MRRAVPVVFLILFCGCAFPARYRELATAVEEHVAPIQNGQLPPVIANALSDKRVLFLGEHHWIQEQKELIVALLPALHAKGVRTLLCESSHAYGWIAEDYVLGEIDEIPSPLRACEGLLLDGVRQFNAPLPPSDRIRVQYFDMNHDVSAFFLSFRSIVHRMDTEDLFKELQEHYTQQKIWGLPEYRVHLSILEALLSRLHHEQNRLEEKWGLKWYERIREMVEVEKASIEIRIQTPSDHNGREKWMIHLVDRRIAEAAGKVAVSIGMGHAQKRNFPGFVPGPFEIEDDLLGEHIRKQYPSYHIAFYGAQGQVPRNYNSRERVNVNNLTDLPREDLLRILTEKSDGRMVALPLEAGVFRKWTRVNRVRVKPGEQFDAYVLFPHMSPLKSLESFYPPSPMASNK